MQSTSAEVSSRPEFAFVLLLLQAAFWAIAGISALPFALAGEHAMGVLGGVTIGFALVTCLVALGVLWRRKWARRFAITQEAICAAGSLLLMLLPIGANHGPVSLMVNLVLPIAIILLVRRAFP
jgi:hypothetical protein